MLLVTGLSFIMLWASACLAGSVQPDEIYGDGFDGFDATACDAALSVDSTDPADSARAIDLCATAQEIGHAPGLISATYTLADGSGTPALIAHKIRTHFGTNNVPRYGGSLLVLSTGAAAAPGDPGYSAFDPGTNNGKSSAMPADWLAANGGNVPSAPSCPPPSAVGGAQDPVMMTLRIRVPGNAHSFSLDANFFASDYPEYVCSNSNDIFVALLDSAYGGLPTNPADKNLATYTTLANLHYPLGVNLARDATGLFTQCVNGTTGCFASGAQQTMSTCTGTSGLIGTGMDVAAPGLCDSNSMRGGATGWLTMRGNVLPGEVITLRLAVWDSYDHSLDSLVLLDHFRWSAVGVTPGVFTP